MLPLRFVRVTATKRLFPAITAHSFSTTSIYRNKDPIKAAQDVAQPHLPNRSSTVGHDVPKVGAANAPPEFLGMVDPNYKPQDAGSGEAKSGEVTGSHAATGEVGSSDSASVGHKQQGQGEASGDKSKQDPVSVSKGNQSSSEPLSDSPATAPSASAEINDTDWTNMKHEPLKRDGEDERTMRARLVYQSRKRGILETDLLLSTFADEHLPSMSVSEMAEYDEFLDENDWDIYYFCTQESPTDEPESLNLSSTTKTSHNTSKPRESASPAGKDKLQAPPGALGMGAVEQPPMMKEGQGLKKPYGGENSGEWAQTVGTVKQAYRPVPEKWKDSNILKKLRAHVESRKATADGDVGKGMGRMPDMKTYNS